MIWKKLKYIYGIQFISIFIISCENRQNISKCNEKINFSEKCRKLVLNENRINQEYTFKRTITNLDELHIIYLGNIKTVKGDILKFVNSINYFGLYVDSKRANGSLFIYNGANQFLGVYHFYDAFSVPTKIEESNLIFNYKNESCNQTTTISFFDSIPRQIFIGCKKSGGDLYKFTNE